MIDRGPERTEREAAPPTAERQRSKSGAQTDHDHPPERIHHSGRSPAREVRKEPGSKSPTRPEPISQDDARESLSRHRQRSRNGRATYAVSAQERQTLYEVGRFRVARQEDVALYRYCGRTSEWEQDLRNLTRQRLLQKKTVWTGRHREKVTCIALTKAGKNFLKRGDDVIPQQAIYAGFVKPAELRHDAAIYPMFQKEATKITADGGRITRVVLDYELKKKAYSPLARAKALPAAEYAKRQAEIARAHGLKVVNGHIALPDLRIEYITRTGLAASVDLELATESYHGSHAAEKASAGFRIYAAADTAARLSAVLEEREITAEILSL